MFSRVDVDSAMCLIGGCLVGLGRYFDTVLPSQLSVEAVIDAERKSILAVEFSITETLFVTPADIMQIIGVVGIVIGFCNLVCKKLRTWYNSRKSSEN